MSGDGDVTAAANRAVFSIGRPGTQAGALTACNGWETTLLSQGSKNNGFSPSTR